MCTVCFPRSHEVQCVYGVFPQITCGSVFVQFIDILNKDCRRSCSAILTWVPENVKISARPLNSIGN